MNALPGDLHRTMVIAVTIVRMMQVSVDEVIDMITMGHRLVPATGTMDMSVTDMIRRTGHRIHIRDFYDMLVHMTFVRVMQVSVMQIINMITVLYGGMTTARAMGVVVILMLGLIAGAHTGSFRCAGPGCWKKPSVCQKPRRFNKRERPVPSRHGANFANGQ